MGLRLVLGSGVLAAAVLAAAACDDDFAPEPGVGGGGAGGSGGTIVTTSSTSTGMGGVGAFDPAVPCGDGPPTGQGDCPDDCDECKNDTCYFRCADEGSCNTLIKCPAGWKCQVTCTGQNSCGGQIVCHDDFPCSISCNGSNACRNNETICGARSDCSFVCAGGACELAIVSCDEGKCTATCFENGPMPTVNNCDQSCQCSMSTCSP
jgi:hypothetical protein